MWDSAQLNVRCKKSAYDALKMNEPLKTKQEVEKAWWHWLVYGPFTPFFRAHGFRKLSVRESAGLAAISIAVVLLSILALGGWL